MSLKDIISLLSNKPQTQSPTPEERLLKAELESRDRIEKFTAEKIRQAWEAYKTAGYLFSIVVTFVIGGATFYGCRSVADIRKTVELESNTMRTNLTSQIDALRNSVTQEVVRVQTETKKEIANQFASTNIQNLVHEEAQQRVQKIADPLISSNITAKIEPRLKEIDASLEDSNKKLKDIDSNLLESNNKLADSDQKADELRKLIAQADNALKQLNESSDFLQKTVLADHDDRNAFEALLNICSNPTNKYQSEAIAIAGRIRQSYFNRNARVYVNVPWLSNSAATNRNSWSMSDINTAWKTLPTQFATDYVRYVSGRTNLANEQKLCFFRNAYLKDSRNSLQAADEAAYSAAALLNVVYNPPFVYAAIEAAWKEYIQTNHICNIDTSSTNVVYDLILSSDTNRFGIVKDFGETKVVLLKLRFVPKGTIEGKWINYKTGEIDTLSYRVYLNLVSALFVSDSYEDTKFEFKYEADTTRTNVYSSIITTNLLNENGSFNIDRIRSKLGQ